jgi:Integrase zinc binding domain
VKNQSDWKPLGILGIYHRVRKYFYWPKLKETVLQYVQFCDVCLLNKGEHVLSLGLLEPISIPNNAWEVIIMDFISGLSKSCGKDVLMVIINKFIKYYHLITLTHPFKASDVAHVFLDSIYKRHGLPLKIIIDRDPVFTSVFWKEIMEKLRVTLNFSTSYHPQMNGQSERLNQCVESYLRCMIFQKPKIWARWISLAEWWYNTNFHTTIKRTPFEVLYGYSPPQLSLESILRSCNPAVNEVLEERQKIVRLLKEELIKAQSRMKKYADLKRSERSFYEGDWVYLKLQSYRQVSVKGNLGMHKLKSKFYGPLKYLKR